MTGLRGTPLLYASVLFLSVVAAGAPQVNFPLSAQSPPIARVGQPFSFQFAATTFTPEPDKLQFSLIGSPSWLSLHGENRTLSGIPSKDDAGPVTFTIAAAGEAGAVANMESRLVVTDEPGPTVTANISDILSKAGSLSGPKRLALLPSNPFQVDFSADTFQSGDKKLFYFASLANHTPLPSWISFDAPSLRFAGTTPPGAASPQTYEILLMASDTPGYATASLSFSLVVSDHQLLFKPLQETINVTKGERINITGLRGKLFLDNNLIGDGKIQSTKTKLPSWLTFDDESLDIQGSPPTGLMSQDIDVSVTDKYGDTANHSIRLVFKSGLFSEEIGGLNITAGKYFEHQIPRTTLTSEDEVVRVDFGSLAEWLEFNPSNLTLSGTIPADHTPGDVQVTMIATSKDGQMKDTQTFQLHVTGSNDTGVSNPPSDESTVGQMAHPPSKRAGVIAGATVGALIGASICVALLLVLCRRRKKQEGYISPRTPRSPRKADISRPIMIHEDWERNQNSFDRDLEKGDSSREKTPEHPPKLNLELPPRRKASQSFSSSISESETKILTAFDRSSWGFKDEAGPSHRPHESMKIPTAMARRESEKSTSTIPPVQYHAKTTTQRDSHRSSARSSGLPVNRRLTGLGHGRHTRTPSRSNNSMAGLRRPLSTNTFSTKSTSILSTVPSTLALPQSPAARHTTQLTTPMDKRRSVRLVASPSNILVDRNLVDRRTIDEKRRSYIRKRASAQFPAPFFGADSDRSSSANYKSPPAFINDSEPPSQPAPSPTVARMAAKADVESAAKFERELPDSLRIRKPSETPSVEPPKPQITFSGSLRKPVVARSFTNRYTSAAAADQNRIQKRHERPGTAMYPGTDIPRRRSARQSLRAHELKSSLNDLTGSKIFDDAEMSESVYSTEEEDIEEYERRTTIKPSYYTLPPLNLSSNKNQGSKRNSKRDSKRNSKRDSARETTRESKALSKKVSERDPTPYSLAIEHGGKENQSSTYSLDLLSYAAKGKAKAAVTSASPERPKTTIATMTQPKPRPRHSRTESRITTRSSTTQREGETNTTARHSQQRGRHSRTQSRYSTTKQGRDRSRTQSSAYPYFDAGSMPLGTPPAEEATAAAAAAASKDDKDNASTLPTEPTDASLLPRDLSGNILNYADAEDPTIEELDTSSIGFRASNGRVNSSARRSRLARSLSDQQAQMLSPTPAANNAKRNTAIGPETSTTAEKSIGLGVDLGGGSLHQKDPLVDSDDKVERGRERTPLSTLDDGNGGGTGSPERLRIVEGKAKRPISSEVDEELRVGKSRKGRRTWGRSLRRIVPSGSSGVWGGGAGDRESKAFL